MNIQHVEELFQFIENSPSCFHAIETIRKKLNDEGFIELVEGRSWQIEKGKKYYVTRNLSLLSVIHKSPSSICVSFSHKPLYLCV